MKKSLLLLSLSPVCAFAQAPAVDSGDNFGFIVAALALIVVLFFLCRELICWYYKINKQISNQEEVIRLLKKIANESNAPMNDTKLGESKKGIMKELSDSTKFMATGK